MASSLHLLYCEFLREGGVMGSPTPVNKSQCPRGYQVQQAQVEELKGNSAGSRRSDSSLDD